LDGGGHNYRVAQIRERTRSEFLARKGIVVLRFWNHQVRQELSQRLANNLVCAAGAGACRNPDLSPLPSAKGEASYLVRYLQSSIQANIDKWQDSSLIQQRNSDEPNCNDAVGLSDLQETEIA
jgi:hypothetical protein